MDKKYQYFGIDGPNHLEFPQIYTLTQSNRVSDTQAKRIPKLGTLKSQLGLLKDGKFPDYKHTLIVSEAMDQLVGDSTDFRKFIAYYTLIEKYDEGHISINSNLSENLLSALENSFSNNFSFMFGHGLESNLKIINGANGIRNYLQKYYKEKNSKVPVKEKILEHYIHPNIEKAIKAGRQFF